MKKKFGKKIFFPVKNLKLNPLFMKCVYCIHWCVYIHDVSEIDKIVYILYIYNVCGRRPPCTPTFLSIFRTTLRPQVLQTENAEKLFFVKP